MGRIGAIVIGALLSGPYGYPWGFHVSAAVAVLAVAATPAIGRPRDTVADE